MLRWRLSVQVGQGQEEDTSDGQGSGKEDNSDKGNKRRWWRLSKCKASIWWCLEHHEPHEQLQEQQIQHSMQGQGRSKNNCLWLWERQHIFSTPPALPVTSKDKQGHGGQRMTLRPKTGIPPLRGGACNEQASEGKHKAFWSGHAWGHFDEDPFCIV